MCESAYNNNSSGGFYNRLNPFPGVRIVEMTWMALVFGLCIGSFLNVCIYRLPLGQSIIRPRSRCMQCGNSVRAYDNIPVISYLILRGRCRDCRSPISARYPLVEMMSGVFAAMTVLKYGIGLPAMIVFLFIAALLVITFIDLDHRIIPDLISLPGIPVGFAASFGLSSITPVESLIGILSGGGSLFLVAWGYQLLTRREGMGGGDIKLLAMIGAFLGWKGVIFTVFVSSLTGTLAGMAMIGLKGGNMKLAVPFGPFLAIGAIAYVFTGPELMQWYVNWIR
jgi:leader peptidase (prepilin peptidase) / N-methyltransferase